GRSRKGFFLVGIHAPLTHVMPEHKISDTLEIDGAEYTITPFLTFYFTYDPKHYLETSLAMIDVHEAFERLLGHPYTIATHPNSEVPHPYGSKRLGDLRDWARKTKLKVSFVFNFTDEKNH
ncbi:hypothetical protein IR009_23375, partial [Pseudomonas putida]|nr:hypothetical protein [Pseudomonas putida]